MAKRKATHHNEVELVDNLLSGQAGDQYYGKQVVVIGGEMAILPEDDQKAVKLVEALEKKHPREIPHIISVPRPEAYIV